MTLKKIRSLVNADVLCGEDLLHTEIDGYFACDLISEMLVALEPGALLITSLTNAHVLHTAQVMDASAVLFVAGKKPDQNMIQTGSANGIPLLTTKRPMFDCCGLIFSNGTALVENPS
jgi:predicted transcriptional regulator